VVVVVPEHWLLGRALALEGEILSGSCSEKFGAVLDAIRQLHTNLKGIDNLRHSLSHHSHHRVSDALLLLDNLVSVTPEVSGAINIFILLVVLRGKLVLNCVLG